MVSKLFWWKWLLAETGIVAFSFLAENGYGGNGKLPAQYVSVIV
jgi:hypothetical protein